MRTERSDTRGGALVGCPSGQREQTVNLPASAYEGSNPSPTTRRAGVAQLVEHQPSKLRVTGSSPVARSARVAQSVERVLGKDEVTGSIPVASLERKKSSSRDVTRRRQAEASRTDVIGMVLRDGSVLRLCATILCYDFVIRIYSF